MSQKANFLNSVKLDKPKRSAFDLSFDHKTTMNMGTLVPTMCHECVPGDVYFLDNTSVFRLPPLVSPMMQQVDVTNHYFFIPYRLIWYTWEQFVNELAKSTQEAVKPYILFGSTDSTVPYTRLMDYLGIPPSGSIDSVNEMIDLMPMIAYQCIWANYYADQNLSTNPFAANGKVFEALNGGDYSSSSLLNDILALRRRAWTHDYFTAQLPWAQKGTSVDVPMGKVELSPDWNFSWDDDQFPAWKNQAGQYMPNSFPETQNVQADQQLAGKYQTLADGSVVAYDPRGTLEVEAVSINDLRLAFQLQKFLERDARGGTRYYEKILSHFGVRSSDARLQRPEYIYGNKSPITISEVLQTSSTDGTSPQGNMAGHGFAVNGGTHGKFKCEEFGFIMCITSVMPVASYYQGIPAKFSRFTPEDYPWPTLQVIGEQPVPNREIYAYQAAGGAPFGYLPAYSSFRYNPNVISGQFRSSLDTWHMGRKFSEPPTLSQPFIECIPEYRPFAVTDPNEDHVLADIYHKITAIRPLTKYGNPGGI